MLRFFAAVATLAWTATSAAALRRFALAIALMVAGAVLIARTPVFPRAPNSTPRGSRARMDAIRRSTFRSPSTVAVILPYTRDPDPVVVRAARALAARWGREARRHRAGSRGARAHMGPTRVPHGTDSSPTWD